LELMQGKQTVDGRPMIRPDTLGAEFMAEPKYCQSALAITKAFASLARRAWSAGSGRRGRVWSHQRRGCRNKNGNRLFSRSKV